MGEVYFYFLKEEFSKMVGSENWYGIWRPGKDTEYEIVQHGSQEWQGTVNVWSAESDENGPYGPYGVGKKILTSNKDWRTSDTITLKSCTHSGKLFDVFS